jgi:hypothetical protein
MLAAVAGKISLAITGEIKASHHNLPAYWNLPDSGVHHPAAPLDILWQANIH